MSILLSILTQGLIYSLMALGVYITYSILDFPDPVSYTHLDVYKRQDKP